MRTLTHQSILAAALLGFSLTASAAEVTLTGWAFGSGGKVQSYAASVSSSAYNGSAGGFTGALGGAGSFNTSSFVTYCIELEESFAFSSTPMTSYSIVSAATYFDARQALSPSRPDGDLVAERLGQLISWANDDALRVDTAAESVAMQLAVWNIVYDADWTVSSGSTFYDLSSYQSAATAMLAGAQTTTNRYDVFALTRSGKQDFLLTTLRVPEPGSLALAGLALAALPLVRRRRCR